MQLPEKYKENFNIPSDGPSSGGPLLEMLKFSLYFLGSCIPTNKSLLILLALPTLAQTVQDYLLFPTLYLTPDDFTQGE
jgi:uncharacterized protein involved in cysteine biosynthesis